MLFLPHLFRTLVTEVLAVEVSFDFPCRFSHRKTAARVAWRQVQTLRQQRAIHNLPVPQFEHTC
jgi:hypothetical protein